MSIAVAFAVIRAGEAAVVLDGTMGTAGPIAGPAYQIPAAVGRQVGTNLFHSFSMFGVAAGEGASFSGPPGITNVLARVTGGTASTIDGLLRSSIAGASFYLLNPAGIVFGPNASLDVGGSFYASTAHFLRLADGGRFAASAAADSVLTTAPVAAFGFLGPSGSITLNRAALAVPSGRTIGLIGGEVTIGGGNLASGLTARSGDIVIASAASAGEAVPGAGGVDVNSIATQGAVRITDGATLNANEAGGAGGGRIFIRAGRFVLENATLAAHTQLGNGRGVDIAASSELSISGQGSDQSITTSTLNGAGNAGPISLRARSISIANGAQIDSSSDPACPLGCIGGSGSGGAIGITAAESVVIAGAASAAAITGIASNTFGSGNAGNITIDAARVELDGLAAIQSSTTHSGRSGTITLGASEVLLRGGAQLSSATLGAGAGGAVAIDAAGAITIAGMTADGAFPSAVFTDTFALGAAGSVAIRAGTLRILGGGEISSTSRQSASAAGGDVRIDASGAVEVAGTGPGGKASAIVTNTFGAARAGSVAINAARLDLREGARLQSQSQGAGDGGNVVLNAGTITIESAGQVSVDTRESGRGGSIFASVADQLGISGANSGLFANAYLAGRGGDITVRAGRIALADGGGLFAFAQGQGRSGNIDVAAADGVTMTDRARVSVQSFGTGDAGAIHIDAGNALRLDGAAISTEAVRADGGNITVRARDLIVLNRSVITATVQGGLGDGGNIDIDPALITLIHSDIIANAFGGDGGNIRLSADQFLRSPDSVLSASSQLGISGTVIVSSPITDLTGALEALSSAFLDTGALLGHACAARLSGRASSLVVAGRGGLQAMPDAPVDGSVIALAAGPTHAYRDVPLLAARLAPRPTAACAK